MGKAVAYRKGTKDRSCIACAKCNGMLSIVLSALITACGNPRPPVDARADSGADGMWLPRAPTLVPGATDRILLVGKIVTPDVEIDGQVLVENSLITCVGMGTTCSAEPGAAGATIIHTNFASGKTSAYLIHCGEGIDATALGEFQTLGSVTTTPGCLYAPPTAITHGLAFTVAEFTTMVQNGMKLTWSPASNVALYGKTADIPTALAAGVEVSLAPDWSMGGSQNLLDELRFADAWDGKTWGNKLTPRDLLIMATSKPAAVVAFQDKIGQIKKGWVASSWP